MTADRIRQLTLQLIEDANTLEWAHKPEDALECAFWISGAVELCHILCEEAAKENP